MSRAVRLVVAAIALPLVATAVVFTIVAVSSELPPVGFVVVVGILSLLVTFVLGIPAYLLSRSWHLRSPAAYAAVGGAVGAIPAIVLALAMPESLDFSAAAICAGVAAGLTLERVLHVGL